MMTQPGAKYTNQNPASRNRSIRQHVRSSEQCQIFSDFQWLTCLSV